MTKELTLELQIGYSQRFTRSLHGTDCFQKLVLTQFGGCRAPPAGPAFTGWRLTMTIKSHLAINPKKKSMTFHSFNLQIL